MKTMRIEKHGNTVRTLVTKAAIVKLNAMRDREGHWRLFSELMKQTSTITVALEAEIQKRAPAVIEDYHKPLAAAC